MYNSKSEIVAARKNELLFVKEQMDRQRLAAIKVTEVRKDKGASAAAGDAWACKAYRATMS